MCKKENQVKERLVFISNARIIGIVLVVFGHSYPLTGNVPNLANILRNFIYCFHMPLFVFVSGYIASKTKSIERHGTKEYIKRRAVKLFVPYLGLSILGYVPKAMLSGYISDDVQIGWKYFVRSLLIPREAIWGHFWFIPMLFVMALVSVFYEKVLKQYRNVMICVCILALGIIYIPNLTNWLGIKDIATYLFWYLFGIFLSDIHIDDRYKSPRVAIISLIIGSICFFVFDMQAYNPVVALFLIVGIMLICTYIDFEKNKFLTMLGKYSYSVFLLSWPVQVIIEIIANRVLNMPFGVVMVCMFFFGGGDTIVDCIYNEESGKDCAYPFYRSTYWV